MNATADPSAEIDGSDARPPAGGTTPPGRLRRTVEPLRRSRTKTSWALFVSLATRSGADDANATQRPLSEIDGVDDGPAGNVLARLAETSVVVPGGAASSGTSGVGGCLRGTAGGGATGPGVRDRAGSSRPHRAGGSAARPGRGRHASEHEAERDHEPGRPPPTSPRCAYGRR